MGVRERSDLERFINFGWELGAQTTLSAKLSGQGGSLFTGAMSVRPGVWLNQMSDDGLAVDLTAKGSKYYRNKSLNKFRARRPAGTNDPQRPPAECETEADEGQRNPAPTE